MTTAAVVGSGPNGLAAAIRLAQAGLDVTVLEAADVPGGGTRTSELTLPGLLHDDCSAFHPTGVVSPFLTTLGLEQHGLEWAWPELDLAHPLDDGRAGVMSRDADVTAASLGPDADRWRQLLGRVADDVETLLDDVLGPVLHVPKHPIALARFGLRAALPATTLVKAFRDEPAKALFMGVAAHQHGRLDLPLGSAVGMLLTTVGMKVGWPVAVGGSRAISDAMISLLAQLGGTVRTGIEVTSLDQVAELVPGEHGGRPDVMVLDVSPRAALRIVGDEMPTRIARALRRFRYGPSAFKLDLAVEGGVPWTNPDARRAGTVHLGGTAAEVAAVEAATERGEMPDRPFVLVGQQHLADPTRSFGDLHPLWAYAHVPHGWSGDATEHVLAQIERFAPGFRDCVVKTAVRGTSAVEAHDANYVGGDIGVGANTARQLVLRPRAALDPYSLGVPGVFLCSSATPPGGGVHGMCGYQAATSALRRL